jgi:hypothetical protein
MTTSARAALNAFGRAIERHLDRLLGIRQLEGSEATERGAGCNDPHLLGQVLNGILVGLQTMRPTPYRQTADACKNPASTAACIQQLMCDDPMSPSYYIMGWQCVHSDDHMREVFGPMHCVGAGRVPATRVMPAAPHTATSV